ncbi:capsule biosynthesis protein [Polaribacter filamentus]|uniref:Capsule biosynthesis protein n=1 Tax=Polaribacter filamentus TaxID=53483 RepID=A0A2S7KYU2_9FLAO|nr:SLBB domain-containing protein [Polaribacter filamentus]PQB07842.1 capsule biosynthesis protein [Polaribacter filamentus]
MKNSTQPFLILLLVFFTSIAFSQDISQLKNVDINSMSDDQIESYWSQIKKGGYTMEQVEILGKAQGISTTKIAEFKRRVNSLGAINAAENKAIEANSVAAVVNESFGLKDGQVVAKNTSGDLLFGYDFFRNSKVSFTPSVNIAVPENYQIGPGDEIMIDLWGASEITYKAIVDNSGSIKINGIGFIFINGFTLEDASKKIISKLKTKHAGISADSNSYNKINTNITVSKIRTVQVNIIGDVETPGTYALNSLSTVLNALYVAGGPTKMGTFRDIQLIRANKRVASLDVYQYMLSGTQEGNLKLQDQDVLLVTPYKNLVSVEGAVKRAGIYELKDGQTLAELVQYFGGFTPIAYTNLLTVERLNGTQKEIREVAFTEAKDFIMQGGDKLVVQEILDRYENKITIQGAVYRPGSFELFEKMSLKTLIEKAEGITPEAFLLRGLLVRTFDDTHKENIAFSVSEILNGSSTIVLQARDQVRIFNKEELREKRTITIAGAVNTPNTFDFVDKLQIEDVIAMSGGLKLGADPQVISVSRRLKDGSFKTLSEVYAVSSDENLAINNGTPFYIEPFDIIEVRYSKGYTEQKNVSITGEVKYQGGYVLKNKNERISDLIERAGGLTEYAFVKGASLVRKGAPRDAALFNNLIEVEGLEKPQPTLSEFTVSIDLESVLKNKGTEIDMYLEEGDILNIPTKLQTVKVSGMVLQQSLIPYKEEYSLKNYISKSGGFSASAKESKIYVSYANGDIKTTKRFLFIKSYPKVAPGAVIFVPEQAVKEKMSTSELLGITTAIATLGILIKTMLN